ncbi:MAG: MAE_28990/MAE_18760 family HEPN-like nuclease [Fluviicola sp.]|nr:MAE_28990/MAE_18760 family HEPN-like nuclease [Fluviicola sp.]
MTIEDLWTEIEAEQTWRTDEIRFLQNQLSTLQSENDKDQFRRAVILMLYAHFEGFCKFAFNLYVTKINAESLHCKDVNYAIAAGSLSELFKALRNPDSKSDIFRNALPSDVKLHIYARNRDFIEASQDFENKIVSIPDDYVDTESNLKPIVLRKNLYKLGFPHDLFESIEGLINQLLNFRNKIAHGEMKSGITEVKYEELRSATFQIMNEIKSRVMNALTEKHYLRNVS